MIKSKKILFLGYGRDKTDLIYFIDNYGYKVIHKEDKIDINYDLSDYSFVISYGYRHLLKKEIIDKVPFGIRNLHISYLPYNRGAHPNFWSFYDDTPAGVSIHIIDEGIDTGPILFQKQVMFESNENTFSKTYKRLIYEIELLFREHIDLILSPLFPFFEYSAKGTYHNVSDLPKDFSGWDANIVDEIKRLKDK